MSLKIGEISFINYIPLAAWTEAFPLAFEKQSSPPRVLNDACRKGLLDISPISFFAYPFIEKEYALLPNFCIASDGEVVSVKLFSKFPLSGLGGKKIYLTPDSESSIGALCAICKTRFGYNPRELQCGQQSEADAVFLIGDKALTYECGFEFVYDLGTLWKETFGIPLVFSSLVVKRSIFDEVKGRMLEGLDLSLANFAARRGEYCALAAARLNSKGFDAAAASHYYDRLIFKISDAAFQKSREILHGKAD